MFVLMVINLVCVCEENIHSLRLEDRFLAVQAWNTAQAAVSGVSCISFPGGPDTVQLLEKSRLLIFLYRKGNQSFGMCKQKEEKNIKMLDFFSSGTAFIILNSLDSRYISQSASKKVIFSYITCFWFIIANFRAISKKPVWIMLVAIILFLISN